MVSNADMIEGDRYLAARTVGDEWMCYPWEAEDIDKHDELARNSYLQRRVRHIA